MTSIWHGSFLKSTFFKSGVLLTPPTTSPSDCSREKSIWQIGCWSEQKSGVQSVNKIQHLSIIWANEVMQSGDDEYALIVECQELRSLTWSRSSLNRYSTYPLVRDLQEDLWPYLERLNFNKMPFTDLYLAEILTAMDHRPLKELRVDGTLFGELGARALLWGNIRDPSGYIDTISDIRVQKRRQSLEILSVVGCGLTGVHIQDFLCNFPNLIRFKGDSLTSNEVQLDPRPWACNRLKPLELTCWLELTPPNLSTGDHTPLLNCSPSLILHRIASLTQLERLLIEKSSEVETWNGYRRLHLRDDMGRESLRVLKKLRQISWSNCDGHMTHQEAEWIMKSWPRLEDICAIRSTGMNNEIVKLFDLHEIDFGISAPEE